MLAFYDEAGFGHIMFFPVERSRHACGMFTRMGEDIFKRGEAAVEGTLRTVPPPPGGGWGIEGAGVGV